MRIYTRTGDDGTTGLRHGARVRKDSARVEANGAIDEAQAALGVARAECEANGALDDLLVGVEQDLWVAMAEVATPPGGPTSGVAGGATAPEPGVTSVSEAMIAAVEAAIDAYSEALALVPHFAVPGGSRLSSQLDLARTVVRRAERAVLACGLADSLVLVYLNRLSDLCFVLARASEDEHLVNVRAARRGERGGAAGRTDQRSQR